MHAQASFGPFYRIEQLILSTTPAAQAPYQTPSGLPAILTDANIRLLFQMQAAVDALAGPVAGSNASATLQQVCYKPLGDDCATQSILQVSRPQPPDLSEQSMRYDRVHGWSCRCLS